MNLGLYGVRTHRFPRVRFNQRPSRRIAQVAQAHGKSEWRLRQLSQLIVGIHALCLSRIERMCFTVVLTVCLGRRSSE